MSIINVTDSAAERIRDLLDRDGKLDSHGLRIRVVGGGCSGLKYELVFDDEFREVDDEIHAGEIRVIIDEKSALYVMGSTLNFVDSLQESGFKLENPNASATCGCGDSFAA